MRLLVFQKRGLRSVAAAILVAAVTCVCAFYFMAMLNRWNDWAAHSINRAGWIVLFHRGGSELQATYAGRMNGVGYRIQCDTVAALGADAIGFVSVFDSHPEARGMIDDKACRVTLSINEETASSVMSGQRMHVWGFVADAGIRKNIFSSRFSPQFLGSSGLSVVIAKIFVVAFLSLLCARMISFRQDLVCAWKAMRSELYVVTLPFLGVAIIRFLLKVLEPLKFGIESVVDRSMQGVALLAASGERGLFNALFYAPVVEEAIFRYAMFTILSRWWSPLFAATIASAAFAISHFELDDTARTISLFAGGMLLQWLYVRHRSLTLCILAHSMLNGMMVMARALTEWY